MEIATKKKDIITSIGTSATLTSLGAAAGAAMAIITFLSYMHIDIIPFAWASDVATLERSIDKLTDAVTTQSVTVLEMQRENYTSELNDAQEELKKNPDSKSAKKEIDRLNQAIADIDKKIDLLKK